MKERTQGYTRNPPGLRIHRQLPPLPNARTTETDHRIHGQITGYFVGLDEYEEFRRFRESRRSFTTAELSAESVEAMRCHARIDGTPVST